MINCRHPVERCGHLYIGRERVLGLTQKIFGKANKESESVRIWRSPFVSSGGCLRPTQGFKESSERVAERGSPGRFETIQLSL